MRRLILVLVVGLLAGPSFAQDVFSEDTGPMQDIYRGRLICGGLSDSRCFSRPVNSICLKNAQKAQPGRCYQLINRSDAENIICRCI